MLTCYFPLCIGIFKKIVSVASKGVDTDLGDISDNSRNAAPKIVKHIQPKIGPEIRSSSKEIDDLGSHFRGLFGFHILFPQKYSKKSTEMHAADLKIVVIVPQ
jgi:hypothetical protein